MNNTPTENNLPYDDLERRRRHRAALRRRKQLARRNRRIALCILLLLIAAVFLVRFLLKRGSDKDQVNAPAAVTSEAGSTEKETASSDSMDAAADTPAEN